MPFMKKRERLGDVLVARNIITEEQLQNALAEQKTKGLMLGEMLVALGYVTQDKINKELCEHLNIDFVELRTADVNEDVFRMLDESFMRKGMLVPYAYSDGNVGSIKVAMADPMNIFTIDDINMITGLQVEPFLCNSKDINAFLDDRFGKAHADDIAKKFMAEQGTDEESESEKLRKEEVENAPIVLLVNGIIEKAARQRASDIHIEPFETYVRVRYRIDGSLVESIKYERGLLSAIIARLKIMSGMDISEKRKPQDGRITLMVDNTEYDIRVSNLPTVYGEKVVMRLASKEGFNKEITDLGMTVEDMDKFKGILRNPHGIILVTGPTGSGKSTTLYTALSSLNSMDKNIITVEDPVEANIAGINQVQVNNKADLTFASALRSILRQDPDIIMIGEIRDTETAEIAVRASITGHLVVSTLHTNSTYSSISRLVDMGIEPYLISDSLVGVIAQRLVKRLCNCAEEYEASESEKRALGVPVEERVMLKRPKGCKYCNELGYRGRIGVYEILEVTPAVKKIISSGGDADAIKVQAVADGMNTLKRAAAKRVLEQVTSFDEMLKVSYEVE